MTDKNSAPTNLIELANFLAARFGPEAPQSVAQFRSSLLMRGDGLGAARLGCVQALWSHTKAAESTSAPEAGWPRVYIGAV